MGGIIGSVWIYHERNIIFLDVKIVNSTMIIISQNRMERTGSRLSVASKGSKGHELSIKIDATSSGISTSSKTSNKSLTKLDAMTPAVIKMDPNLADAVISPLNMQQEEDERNDIVVDINNSMTKGGESNCGWFGISCQDRFNCFNYQSESTGAEDRDITGKKEIVHTMRYRCGYEAHLDATVKK